MTDTRNMTLRNLADYYDPKLPESALVTVPNGLLEEQKAMAEPQEFTQPEKLGRSIIEQYLDGRDVMDSYTMSVDILAKLGNAGLKIARVVAPDEGGVK